MDFPDDWDGVVQMFQYPLHENFVESIVGNRPGSRLKVVKQICFDLCSIYIEPVFAIINSTANVSFRWISFHRYSLFKQTALSMFFRLALNLSSSTIVKVNPPEFREWSFKNVCHNFCGFF